MKFSKLFTHFGLGQEREYVIEQLSMLLGAGMPVATALAAIRREIKSHRLQTVLTDLSDRIEAGSSIASALDSVGIFPPSVSSLIRVGEQSGRLAENLKVVAVQRRKEKEFRSKVSSAMMYPIFVFSLTVIVGVGIAWFILPRLAVVFAQLHVQLPLITRILIGIGTFLGQYGAVVVPALFVATFLGAFFLFVFPKTNAAGQMLLFSIGPISQLLTELELSRFGSLLGNLLEAGLPILDSLESLAQSSPFYRYKKLYRHLHDRVAEGNSFSKSFDVYKHTGRLIPVPIQQLIVTSEQSGNLPATLVSIGDMYEARTEVTAKNITVLLEPILLVIVWLGVLAVAIAVILPLYSLVGGLNQTPASAPPPVISQTPTPTPEPSKPTLRVLDTGTDFLNMRRGPALTGQIIGKATPGETYPYLDVSDGWYQIQNGDTVGWVSADYVEEIN